MEKSTKILIGAGILGLLGYYLYKNKSTKSTNPVSTTSKESVAPVPVVTPVTPAAPAAPVEPVPVDTPIVPEVPVVMPEPVVVNPIIHPVTGKLVPPTPVSEPTAPIVIPDLPPIVIDYSNLNPNIGSSLVNTNVVSTDPYANCKTQKEWDTIKMKGGIVPADKCVIFEGSISGQTGGSFDMKTTKDTTLENSNASLNDLMRMGQDYGDTQGGMSPLKRSETDPYGYGGNPSQ
jgi:hypothetical protein